MCFVSFVFVFVFSVFVGVVQVQVVIFNKGGFVFIYDCSIYSVICYEYMFIVDIGFVVWLFSFYKDLDLLVGCLGQISMVLYVSIRFGYDCGYLVMFNYMDYDVIYICCVNYMINIVLQVFSFNQGIWVKVENVVECYCDIVLVDVYGGVVYGDFVNDYFLVSYGILMLEFFWKMIIICDLNMGIVKVISWIIFNEVNLGSLDNYLVMIVDLEELLGVSYVVINVLVLLKNMLLVSMWLQLVGCDLG